MVCAMALGLFGRIVGCLEAASSASVGEWDCWIDGVDACVVCGCGLLNSREREKRNYIYDDASVNPLFLWHVGFEQRLHENDQTGYDCFNPCFCGCGF